MPLNVRSILQGGSDITLKSFFKIRQDKEKKKTKTPTKHPMVCFHPFLDPFKHRLGWGRGYEFPVMTF